MKPKILFLLSAIACSNLSVSEANPFSLEWFTVDSGGGTSTSADGRFSVSGTAGQPDGGLLAGAGFTLEGGFNPAAGPTLPLPPPHPTIRQAGTNVVVSWAAGVQGLILEYADELRDSPPATVWTPVNPQPTGPSYTVPVTGTQRYFRLRSP